MAIIRTQVGIIGAGPAGLMLAHLLHLQGIESVVLESHTREYVESRVRAGVLEQGTVDMLRDAGVGARMAREGLQHGGVELRFAGEGHRIDFQDLVGKSITVYAQQEVVKDLIAARLDYNAPLFFEAEAMRISDFDAQPRIQYAHLGIYARNCLRLHRGLRWVPRDLPPSGAGQANPLLRARLPLRVAGNPGAGGARFTRTDL